MERTEGKVTTSLKITSRVSKAVGKRRLGKKERRDSKLPWCRSSFEGELWHREKGRPAPNHQIAVEYKRKKALGKTNGRMHATEGAKSLDEVKFLCVTGKKGKSGASSRLMQERPDSAQKTRRKMKAVLWGKGGKDLE